MASRTITFSVTTVLVVTAVSGVMAGPRQTCFGERATVTGGGGETIEGTPGDDVIIGRSSDDVIRGLGGDDKICGGGGIDLIAGGAGDDKMSGGAGTGEDDIVSFESASRGVRVNLGRRIALGQGRDTVVGFEIVVGSGHDDTLIGDPDAAYEELRGRNGNDTIRARAAITILSGDRGNDTLVGGRGDDDFFPGGGNDSIDGAGGDGRGFDALMYWGAPQAITVDGATSRVTGHGTDTFAALDVIFGSHLDDKMLGGSGRDVFNGDEGDDLMRGREGTDRLLGDIGRDRIFGGSGDDHLDGQTERDRLDGGSGTDECLNGEQVTDCE